MSILFIIGTALLVVSIIVTIGAAFVAHSGLRSAKSADFLEEFYEEELK